MFYVFCRGSRCYSKWLRCLEQVFAVLLLRFRLFHGKKRSEKTSVYFLYCHFFNCCLLDANPNKTTFRLWCAHSGFSICVLQCLPLFSSVGGNLMTNVISAILCLHRSFWRCVWTLGQNLDCFCSVSHHWLFQKMRYTHVKFRRKSSFHPHL